MRRGRTISLFLLDGSVTGAIKYTLPNWTGVVYKIPRNALDICKNLNDDLKQSGVYFLFGKTKEKDEDIVYVGQAATRQNGNSFLQRIREPHCKAIDDCWNEVIFITTKDKSWGQTEICYLEHRFAKLATAAKRYSIANRNTPNAGNITEEKESELEDFIDSSKIIMEILGHKVFAPRDKSIKDTLKKDIVYLRGRGAEAIGILTDKGIIVCKGSKIRESPVPSCPDWVEKLRTQNSEHIKEFVLTEDISFSSPSQAAAFCVYGTANGRTAWKTETGKTLKELEEEG